MKFVIDENISPDVVTLFHNAGLAAWHINNLKSHPKQRIIDDQLRRLSIQKGFIIVTKDDDFVRSFVSRKVPDRMVFIYGLDEKESLLSRMKEVIPELVLLLETHDFVEINDKEINIPF